MGATFKEDVSNIRNSKVIDIVNEVKSLDVHVDMMDPHADTHEMEHEYGVGLVKETAKNYDANIVAVNQKENVELNESYFKGLLKDGAGVFVDVKGIYKGQISDLEYWSL